ncbi:MAG: DUF5682 family protein [Polyangiaceae bacterium]
MKSAKKGATEKADKPVKTEEPDAALQRPPAEVLYADELARLAASDSAPRPPGWRLSPRAVRAFIVGDEALGLRKKFVGHTSLVDRAMVALATSRGLMLVGEPGTAKSLLSELLAAAISGDSTLTIQGSAAATEDQIKYSWNYALLLAEGPTPRALVPSPLYVGMQRGAIVRFEEITRCPLEIQDALLGALSDRVLAVPELDQANMLFARAGFNVIATANTRDLGVNEMSAALKRRFNFETVFPIRDHETELALVREETRRALARSGVPQAPPDDVLELLVTTFRELRAGQTKDGQSLDRPSTAMSTAEAVSVAHAVGVRALPRRRSRDAGRSRGVPRRRRGEGRRERPRAAPEVLRTARVQAQGSALARLLRSSPPPAELRSVAMGELTILGVRHHSPACARLTRELCRELRPRFILIEGPSDMNERLGELALDHAPPVALYTYHLAPDAPARGTWTPFCAYSPEWVALRAAAELDAEALFIDLPAWHEAFSRVENRYADRSVSDHLEELAHDHGFDSTDALWDHLFEQDKPLADLARELETYFDAYRGEEPAGERDTPRETFMARWIAWAMHEQRHSDRGVLVVCGGFHAPALRRLWRQAESTARPTLDKPQGRTGSYLVPYSFHRLDSFTGYASGMPSPGFYQAVWDQGASAPERMLHAAARRLREKGQRISSADLVAASEATAALARLRGHATPTRCDVLDGMVTAFVKDALDRPPPWTERAVLARGTDPLLVEIVATFSGDARGALDPRTPRPPLVTDVEVVLASHELSLTETARDLALDPLEPRDAARRRVLHRLLLLEIPGIELVAAPDFSRIVKKPAERWRLVRTLETEAALIERAVYGADLEHAALARLTELLGGADRAAPLVELLERAILAGFTTMIDGLVARARDAIEREPALADIGRALARLLTLVRTEPAIALELLPLLEHAAERTGWLLEGRSGANAPHVRDEIGAVVALRGALSELATVRGPEAIGPLTGVLARRAAALEAPPWLRGACLGALWVLGARRETLEHLVDERAAREVVDAIPARSLGDFLAGLFALAREEFLASTLLELVDARLAALEGAEFLADLPALRAAFAHFPPRERLAIAQRILRARGSNTRATPGGKDRRLRRAAGLELEQTDIDASELVRPVAEPEVLSRGAALEAAAFGLLERYHLARREP